MPTGYTAKLYEGQEQSFPEFVLSCAHAFCIALRDAPIGSPIPEFVPDTKFYDEQIAKGNARLDVVRAWTDEEANTAAGVAHEAALERWRESEAKSEAVHRRYEEMLAQVDQWTPPTENHVELKKFMHDQLLSSIEFDAGGFPRPERMSGAAYAAEQIRRAASDVSYGTEHRAKELELAEANNAWAEALTASLSVPAK